MTDSLPEFMANCQNRINHYLDVTLPLPEESAKSLYQAIRYSVLNGGKRIRPILCYAAAKAVSANHTEIDAVAASVELIHAYSLVHDDLPAMDNDSLRRGKPTCHIAFDEATAILAGDALQTLAFESLSYFQCQKPETVITLIQELSKASGVFGMVAGQAIDIAAVNKPMTLKELQHMHQHKTGALIKSSILMGAIATEQQDQNQLEALASFGELLGLAFQIQDDVLDVISDTGILGKNQGADNALNKPTYTSLLGLAKAQQTAKDLAGQAIDLLDIFNNQADQLRQLADYVVSRDH